MNMTNSPKGDNSKLSTQGTNTAKASWWTKQSLKAKATILAVGIGTIPTAFIGGSAYYASHLSFTNQISNAETARAAGMADKVNRFMAERYGDVQTLSDLPAFNSPKVINVVSSSEKNALLDQFIQNYGVYDSIAVFDTSGNAVSQSAGAAVANHKDRSYFQEAVKTGKAVISQPEVSKTTGKVVIHFAAPIRNKATGQIMGVVRSRMPIASLEEVIKNFSDNGEQYHLVDASGKFFAALEKDQVGRSAKDEFQALAQRLETKKTGVEFGVETMSKRDQLIAYAPLKQFNKMPDLKWDAIIAVDKEIAFKPERELALLLFLGTLGASAAVAAVASILANRATQPILASADAVGKIGQGQLDTRVAVTGTDELAVLGGNINLMAGQIQSFLTQQEESARKNQLLAEVAQAKETQALVAPLNPLLEEVRKALNAERAVIYRFYPDWSGHIAGEAVLPNLPLALADKIQDPCIPLALREAYKQGRVVPTNDVFNAGFHPEHLDLMKRLQIKANLVVPVVQGDELLGLLVVHHCTQTHDWQQAEIDAMQTFAAEFAPSLGGLALIERKQTEAEQSQKSTRKTQLLAEVSQAKETQALVEPLNPLLEEVRSTLDAERAVIYRFYPDWSGHIAGEAVLPNLPLALADKIQDPCIPLALREAYKQGRVVPTDDVFNAGFHPEHLDLMKRLQIKANLVVPIVQGDELLGLLVVHHCTRVHNWQQSEIDVMQKFAADFAPSLGGLALIERKQSEAEQSKKRNEALQMELLTLLQDVEGASSGDLTVRADVSAGEIGIVADFFNSIVESLRDIVSQVKVSAGQVNTSVGSNEMAMGQLADQSQAQAQQITDTLKSVELMALSIKEVAENARLASQVSGLASRTAESGGETIDRTVESILQLRDTVAETAKKVKRLGESSQQISKVVSLINQIALQTNLLAINASIEAARAGEEGRGFAVVAEEVGALAAQSANATKEIEGIVEAIQRETSEVVDAMENGTTQVVEGTRQVNEAKESLNQIVKVSREIDGLLKSISTATVSQTETSQVVKLLMQQITESSEQTSTTSRQVSSSLQETVAIAQQLQASVETFKVDE
jgi:methyl-accepting chemotaxis protein PixJ